MRIITNHLIDDILLELAESAIWCTSVSPAQTHPDWCESDIAGHVGPCIADRAISGTRGIRNITVAMHANGHICVALGLYQHIHAEADTMPLKSGIADILREITA